MKKSKKKVLGKKRKYAAGGTSPSGAGGMGLSPNMAFPLIKGFADAKYQDVNSETPNAPTDSQAISQGVLDASKMLPGMSGKIAQVGDLAANQVGQMIGDKNMSYGVSYTTTGEGIATGAISKGAAGAAIGNSVGGPMGAAVGGGIGLVYGGIEGGVSAKKQQNAAKQRVKELKQQESEQKSLEGARFYNQLNNPLKDNVTYAKFGMKLTPKIMNNKMMYGQEGMQVPAGVGGKPMGPNHEQGGLPVIDPNTGEPVAEMEGNERIFSQEDTAMIEEMAIAIMEAGQTGDQQSMMEMAAQLGMAVVDMLMKQEEAMGAQEAEMGGDMGGEMVDPASEDMTYMEIPA